MAINGFFEVVIIGGGPSGSTAGNQLLKSGIRACIIDRQIFPRNKLCGGLLTKKTIELLKGIDISLDGKIENSVNSSVKFKYKKSEILYFNINSSFNLINRYEFDNLILDKFKEMGGVTFEGVAITCIDYTNNTVLLSDGSEIKYKYLIGADGANSTVRKYVDRQYKPNGFCMEVNIDKNKTCASFNNVSIFLGVIEKGYGWIFPKNNHITVGIGGEYNKNIDYKNRMSEFLFQNELNCDMSAYRGAFIPFGKYVKKPILNNIILVGDAAGLVDPISGEGIYFSILSGIYGADSIVRSIKTGSNDYSIYYSVLDIIHKIIDREKHIQFLIYNNYFGKILLNIINGHNQMASFICDNLISQYNYKNHFKLLIDSLKYKA